jgi:hypothetical protein
MAQVIRTAIIDSDVLTSISENDAMSIAEKAMHVLEPSEVRSFIFQCFKKGKVGNGLAMLDASLEYAAKMKKHGNGERSTELLGAAVSAIALLSTSDESAKEKLFALLEYGEPDVVATVVENMGRSNEVGSFRKICGLLLRDEFKVQMSAMKYAEDCARNAAFLKMPDAYAMAPTAEDFMRNALVSLEKIYEQLKAKNGGHVQKRVAILVAMTYNEILDTTDWKRLNEEQVNEVIYYHFEDHLHEKVGPEVLPLLFKMLSQPGIDEGVRRCVLNTIGRMGNNEKHRDKVRAWTRDYIGVERSVGLLSVARMIRESCIRGERFSSIPAPAHLKRKTSIIPKGVGPLKR